MPERILRLIGAGFVMVVITALLVFPAAVGTLAERLEKTEGNLQLVLIGIALLIDAAVLIGLGYELRRSPIQMGGFVVRSGAAAVRVTLESVESHLTNHLERMEDVFLAVVKAQTRRGEVVLKLDITARDSIDVREKTQQIHRELVKVVEKQMGLKLASMPGIQFRLVSQPPTLFQAKDNA